MRIQKICSLILLLSISTFAFANLPFVPLTFPRDEGAHYNNIPYSYEKIIEWWYFNGRATSDDGKHLSFDIAMFNVAKKLLGYPITTPMLHIQIADLDNKKTYGSITNYWPSTGNFNTETLDIAVKNDYVLQKKIENDKTIYILKAQGDDDGTPIKIELKLEPMKEPFLISGNGLMQMLEDTNSYYYTIPEFKTTGTITIKDSIYQINNTPGNSWMDHQWGDFDVQKHGWEWFSVRLSNGLLANVFLFLENKNNRAIGGLANIILPSGEKQFLPFSAFNVTRDNYWYDADVDISYPLTFNLDFKTLGLKIENVAAFPEQEKHGYWEGYCDVKAIFNKQDLTGFSYTELVYDDGKSFSRLSAKE